MPSRKGASCAAPRWMRCRYASHCPVIAGLFTSGCTTSIRRMPLSVASRLLPLRTMYSRLSSTSMMEARVAGVPRPRLLHRVGEFLLIERLARRLHGGEQRAFGEALRRRASSCASDFDIEHVLRLALGEPRRQRLLRRASSSAAFGFLRASRGAMSSTFQPTCCDGAAARCDSGRQSPALRIAVITVVTRPDVIVVPGAAAGGGRSGRRSCARPARAAALPGGRWWG